MLINLTPHKVKVGEVELDSAGNARCTEKTETVKRFDGVDVVRKYFSNVEGLPEPTPDTMYIVSAIVRYALPERKDLLSPGEYIRDTDGNILGCKNLLGN